MLATAFCAHEVEDRLARAVFHGPDHWITVVLQLSSTKPAADNSHFGVACRGFNIGRLVALPHCSVLRSHRDSPN
jgi:hypothetical protein